MRGGISDLRESSQTASKTKETRPGADPWGMGGGKSAPKKPSYSKDQQAQMVMQRLQNAKDSLSSTMSQVNSRLSDSGYASGGLTGGYDNVPDGLMGFRKNGPNKGYHDTKYPHSQKVRLTWSDGSTDEDEIKGMNKAHAMERARRNWPAATKVEPADSGYAQGGMVQQKPGVQSGPLGGLAYWRPTTAVNPNGGAASAPQQGTPNVFANTQMPQQTYGGNAGWHPQMAPVNYAPLPSHAGNVGSAGGGGAPQQSGAGASPSAIMQYLSGAQQAAQPTNYGFSSPGGVPPLASGPAPTQPLPGQSAGSAAFQSNPYSSMALTGAIDPRQFQGYASGGYVNVGYNAAAPDFAGGGLAHGMRKTPLVPTAPKVPTTGPGGGGKGFVKGPGTGTSDSVHAPKLSNGEFVFTAKAVKGAQNMSNRMGDSSPMGGPRLLYQSMMNLERAASRG